jgi:hypothetical protein
MSDVQKFFSDDARGVKCVRAEDFDRVTASLYALQDFANEMISAAFEGGSFDGGDIQDMAVKHGLMRIESRDERCGEACSCAEYGFPAECYRKTDLLSI